MWPAHGRLYGCVFLLTEAVPPATPATPALCVAAAAATFISHKNVCLPHRLPSELADFSTLILFSVFDLFDVF